MQNNPLFCAFLTPHRSLSQSGIHKVVALYAVLAAIPGIYFFIFGAWPVVGFLGLDALVLWWALSVSRKSGEAFEEVTLWRDTLEIRHVTAKGRERKHQFNPFWVRLRVEKDHDENVSRLALRNRQEELEIGSFLNPDDKASFATMFNRALRETH